MPKKIESNVQLLSVSVTEGRDGEVEILTGCDKPTAIDLLKRAWNKLSNSFPYSHEEYLRKKELVGKPQPGDSYPKSPMKNWLPRNIFAERTPWTARLLDLEQQRDAILHQIAEERLRVLGREPTGDHTDEHYYAFGVSQAIFDLMGHYGAGQVRRAILGWFLSNDRTDELSEATQKEIYDMLNGELLDPEGNRWSSSNRWHLKYYQGTYVFPDFDPDKEVTA